MISGPDEWPETSRPVLAIGRRRISMRERELSIGRRDDGARIRPDVDLRTEDPGRSVSRRHALLQFDGQHLWLTDLSSGNGTLLDGTAVHAGEKNLVNPGAQILVGDVEVYVLAEPVGPAAGGKPVEDARPLKPPDRPSGGPASGAALSPPEPAGAGAPDADDRAGPTGGPTPEVTPPSPDLATEPVALPHRQAGMHGPSVAVRSADDHPRGDEGHGAPAGPSDAGTDIPQSWDSAKVDLERRHTDPRETTYVADHWGDSEPRESPTTQKTSVLRRLLRRPHRGA